MNPYVGLRPFEEHESLYFFGRNDQKLELLDRLHKNHFVAVVGSSGCGKSSLLRAGLIPALKAGFLIADSDQWVITIMKPGQSPLYRLAEGLLQRLKPDCSAKEVAEFCREIQDKATDAILERIREYIPSSTVNHFLLVDQFEELFRLAMNRNETNKIEDAVAFVNIILELSKQGSLPFYVVITMRSDFIGDCSRFYGLPEALNQSLYLVPRLSRAQMRSVIEGPSKLMGGVIDPALISHLLNEVGKVEDELPLLQHTLMRMWNYEASVNPNGVINFEDYEEIGGIEQALSKHADEARQQLDKDEQDLAREIFQALTIIDENGRKVRRPVSLKHLMKLTGGDKEKILRIIEQFTKDDRCFLIVNKSGDEDDIVFDISHESLIRQWATLNQWVEEEAELVMKYRKWLNYARWYFQRPKKEKKNYLLSGAELQEALAWRKNNKVLDVWANQYEGGYTDCWNYIELSKRAAEKKARLIKRIKQLAFSLIAIALLSSGYMILTPLIQESQKNKAVIADTVKSIDSVNRTQKVLSDFGYTPESMKLLEKEAIDSVMRLNQMVEALRETIDTTITIYYFPKLTELDKGVLELKTLGYNVQLLSSKTKMLGQENNAIWVGTEVSKKINDLRLIAFYLYRSGLKIQSIKLFDNPDKEDKRNSIQIGSSVMSSNDPVWTLSQVFGLTRVNSDGKATN